MTVIGSANLAATNSNSVSAATQVRPAADAAKAAPAATLKSDTVKLSLAANIKLMHHQGMSASIIASRLGVSVKQVDGYIPGSTVATPAATTPAPSSPGKSAEPAPPAAVESAPDQDSSTPAPQASAGAGKAAVAAPLPATPTASKAG